MLRFKGSQHFRQRLLLSTLSGTAIRIDDIRASDQSPGLRDYEACLLRLLEKLTNGCLVEINETGARVSWAGRRACGSAWAAHLDRRRRMCLARIAHAWCVRVAAAAAAAACCPQARGCATSPASSCVARGWRTTAAPAGASATSWRRWCCWRCLRKRWPRVDSAWQRQL
jgi:hypothetical protein